MKPNRAVHIIIAVLFLLFIGGHYLINSDKIQQEVAQRIVHIFENTLETDVDASSISVVYPCGIIINNLVVYDQNKDSLASFGSVALRIKMLPLLQKRLCITNIRLLHPDINLHRDSVNANLNCQFIFDKFKKTKENDSRLNLRINSIILKNGSIRYDVRSVPETKDRFNSNHLHVNNLSAKLSLKNLDDDSLNLVIRKFACTEQSGLQITQTKGYISVGPNTSSIHGFYLNTLNSHIGINRFFINYGLKSKNAVDSPRLSVDLNSIITGADFKALYPKLSSMTDKLDFRFNANGDSKKMAISSVFLQSSNNEFSLNGKADVINYNTLNKISVKNGTITGSMSSNLYSFLNKQLAGFECVIPEQLQAIGNGSFQTDICGEIDNYSTSTSVNCDAGSIDIAFSDKHGFQSASIDGESINLKSILNNNNFDKCDISVKADRIVTSSHYSNGHFSSVVKKMSYKGYKYDDIEISGKVIRDTITAELILNDENAKLALYSSFSPDKQNSSLSMLMTAENINLKALNLINTTDSAQISGNLSANFRGNNINNLHGKLTIENAKFNNENGTFPIKEFLLNIGDLGEKQHIISIISDFLNVSVIGDYKTTTIPASIMTIVNQSLPSLHDWITNKIGCPNSNCIYPCNTFMIDIRLQKTDLFKKVFNIPLSFENTASLQFYVNDCDSIANMDLSIPDLTIGQEHMDNSLLSIDSRKGICSISLNSAHNQQGSTPTDVKGSLTALNNKLSGLLSWKSRNAGEFEGSIQGSVDFQGFDESTNWIKSNYNFEKTNFTVNNIEWQLSPTEVYIDSGKIQISHFDLSHDNQYVRANGIISADSSDVINVALQQINIDELLSMFRMNSLDFKGTASGYMSARSLLFKPVFLGKLSIENFGFYQTEYGNLDVSGSWNDELQHIDINANMIDSKKSSTSISGFFDTKNRSLDFDIDANRTDLHFLNMFTDNIFRDLRGTALGKMKIYGPIGDLNLKGEVILENGYLDQGSINTAFIIKRDTLWFEPNKMIFKDVEFYDENGHDGILTCIINHHNLHNFSVDMNAHFANMQLLNLPKSDNSSIYAKVFAEGSMTLTHNQKNGINIQADARTTAGTQFGYNLSSENVSDYKFLRIVDGSTYYSTAIDSVITSEIKKKSSPRLHLNINVDCTEDAEILLSMNNINGSFRGEGNISSRYNSSDGISLNGIFNVSRGQCVLSLENLIRKNFSILDNSFVRFTGKPADTELNFHTYHSVNSASIFDLDANATANSNVRVRCLMDITGQVYNPTLSFDIDMPQGTSEEKEILAGATSTEEQRNMQFMYLLAVGRFYTYDYSNAENVNGLSPNAMESILNSTVNTQINNILSQVLNTDILSLSSNVTAGSYLYGNSTNMTNKELEGILEARLLNNRLLVNGNFGYRENALNNTSNFIGDFEVQWLLLPKHGISLKGYSKNNDKYFSKTTLTTQGVGVVYEKDFDKIIPNRKSKKSKKSKNIDQ